MKRLPYILRLVVLAVVAMLIAVLGRQGRLDFLDARLEDLSWSLRWRVMAPAIDSQRVFVFPIDDASVKAFAGEGVSWPFPRHIYAEALRRLEALGVAAVGIDLYFPPRDQTPGIPEFASAIASSSLKVVLAGKLDSAGTSLDIDVSEESDDDEDEEYSFVKGRWVLSRPNRELLNPAWGLGLINLDRELNQGETIRHHPLAFPYKGKLAPSLGLATWQAWRGERFEPRLLGNLLQVASGVVIPVVAVASSQSRLEVTAVAEPIWRPSGTHAIGAASPILGCGAFAYRNFHDLVRGRVAADSDPERLSRLRGAIAMIGVGSDYLGDTISVPGEPYAAGILLHASMIDALQQPQGFLRRTVAVVGDSLPECLLGLATIWIFFVQLRFAAITGLVAAVGGCAGLVVFAQALFMGGIAVRTAPLVAGFPVLLAVAYVLGYLHEGREKAMIRDLFGRQVSTEVVEELIRHGGEILQPKRQEISVCFIDVCGFTSFSEKHSPERVLIQLNYYFRDLVKVVHQHHGTLDKFIGDAMMITTGVPLFDAQHAKNMVKLAVEIREQVERMNANLPSGLAPFTVSCGINSGEAILGNVGSPERMEYTVIGDTVNLASRLQGKAGSQQIVIGPRTEELVRDAFATEPLEAITVKGKTDPIQAYRIVGTKESVVGA